MTTVVRLSELKNIGATVERRLQEIGISSRQDLERIGAAAAYRQLKARNPQATLPRCYYLYSLEGALRDVHWDALSDRAKNELSTAAGFGET